MATTHEMHDDGAWAWPCPYCRASNAHDAALCVGCGAQLRDPAEDDLFTTVATDNAQMVNPDIPRVKESLWSTEALPEEEVAQEVPEVPGPVTGISGAHHGAPLGGNDSASGPFSASAPAAAEREARNSAPVFGAGGASDSPDRSPSSSGSENVVSGPFGLVDSASSAPGAASGVAPVAPAPPPADDAFAQQPSAPTNVHRPTPDQHGLSIAVESLGPIDRDRCDTPIAVCGALLGEQEVVLGLLAGHLLGHPAVVALTNTRVLVANARRWKPLVDQFLPGPDLMVHLRHDRDVASITFVQGDRLTGVDDITDVTAAVDLAERIRSAAARPSGA